MNFLNVYINRVGSTRYENREKVKMMTCFMYIEKQNQNFPIRYKQQAPIALIVISSTQVSMKRSYDVYVVSIGCLKIN